MLSLRLKTTMCRKKFCLMLSILSRHYYTGPNPMQCCPRGSRQHCIRKILGQCCHNTFGTTSHKSKLYAMLSTRLQTKLHRKNPCNVVPEALDKTVQEKIHAMSSEQYLVTPFIYIRSFMSKKYEVILPLLWKSDN